MLSLYKYEKVAFYPRASTPVWKSPSELNVAIQVFINNDMLQNSSIPDLKLLDALGEFPTSIAAAQWSGLFDQIEASRNRLPSLIEILDEEEELSQYEEVAEDEAGRAFLQSIKKGSASSEPIDIDEIESDGEADDGEIFQGEVIPEKIDRQTQDKLKSLFKILENGVGLQEMEQPNSLKLTLRPYQKQALWWMTRREQISTEGDSNFENPLFRAFVADDGTKYYLNKYEYGGLYKTEN